MRSKNCEAFTSELVECARTGGDFPGSVPGDLDSHLEECPACRERWVAEAEVTRALREMRMQAAMHALNIDHSRVMRAFERQYAAPLVIKPRKSAWNQSWVWGLAAAAMLLVTASVVMPLRPHSPAYKAALAPIAADSDLSSATASSSDAQALTSDDFVEVPFTPPLAAGELVRVVQTNLDPEELAAYGFEMDPSWTAEVPAEVVVGEDGYPRAVRITDNYQF